METNSIKIYNFRDVYFGDAHVFLTKQEIITLNDINDDIYDRTNNRIILKTRIEEKNIILFDLNILPPVEIGIFVLDKKESIQSHYVYRKK